MTVEGQCRVSEGTLRESVGQFMDSAGTVKDSVWTGQYRSGTVQDSEGTVWGQCEESVGKISNSAV